MKLGVFDHMDRANVPLDQFFEERLQLIEAYDRAGFYGYHVAEHHATPLGVAPVPGIWLSAIAQRTKQLRFGALVYLFIRPPEYLTDAHDRELETLARESAVEGLRCPSCEGVVGPRFLVCPNCTTSLRQPCRRCSEPLDPHWQVCPYCAAPASPTQNRAVEETRVERSRRSDATENPEY